MESVATKEDIARLEAKMESMATKEDIADIKAKMESMATSMATKEDLANFRTDIEKNNGTTLKWLLGFMCVLVLAVVGVMNFLFGP